MTKNKETIVQADSESSQIAGEALVEAIENQLAENDPPETNQTLERLIKSGETRENAIRYIACALSVEVFGALKHDEPYNQERYINNLNALPEMPWNSD